jgi:hypothetical protein
MRREAVVVIPAYREELSPNERFSFEQCLRVLVRHPIALVAPAHLRLDSYAPERHGLLVRRFPSEFFASTRTYNRLMLSPRFYGAFIDYRYLLVYQLDAFVFSDQLSEWCRAGYDYVGAPWIDADWLDSLPIRRPPWSRRNIVGNGGFSLRKTATCWAFASLFKRAARRWPANEDGFWAFWVPSYWPLFRIPPTGEALRFSFELAPAKCFGLSNGRLPFGCHAWEKHDRQFWRAHIPAPEG